MRRRWKELRDWMLINVSKVECVKDFVLRVRFSDGSSGEHDFARVVAKTGPMVEPLQNSQFFTRVFVDWGALTWPNGFELDPIKLYDDMRAAGELQKHAAE